MSSDFPNPGEEGGDRATTQEKKELEKSDDKDGKTLWMPIM